MINKTTSTESLGVYTYEDGVIARNEEKFQQLVERWCKDTINISSMAVSVLHPAYLEIISMGDKAVPLLLRELEQSPSHWFPALAAITGENPIPEEARGLVGKMARAWLEWGRSNNYL